MAFEFILNRDEKRELRDYWALSRTCLGRNRSILSEPNESDSKQNNPVGYVLVMNRFYSGFAAPDFLFRFTATKTRMVSHGVSIRFRYP